MESRYLYKLSPYISRLIFQSSFIGIDIILLKKDIEDLFPLYSFDLVFMNDTAVTDAMAEMIAEPIKAK